MKILPSNGVNIRHLYEQQIQKVQAETTTKANGRGGMAEHDQVDISSDAREVEQAREFAKELPDVRADKIAEIKAKIAAGEYQIDSQAIADRILQQAVKFPS